jgi:hypothetical protein
VGVVNISPMGPVVDPEMQRLVFRPFQTSATFVNLRRSGEGVFHVTDNVEMLARAAVGKLDPPPTLIPAAAVAGQIIQDACRWYAVKVISVDDSQQRAQMVTQVVDQGRQRDFFGWNRAKHAVVEAAILATRLHLLPAEEIQDEFQRLSVLVDKTGGPAEHRAFQLLDDHVRAAFPTEDVIR